MIGLEQGILYSFLFVAIIGIIWGARKIITLEKIIINLDKNMQKILNRIEKEELKIEKQLKK